MFTSSSSQKYPTSTHVIRADLKDRPFFLRLQTVTLKHKAIGCYLPSHYQQEAHSFMVKGSRACLLLLERVVIPITETGRQRGRVFKNVIEITNISILSQTGRKLGVPLLSPPSGERTVKITDALYRSIAKIPSPPLPSPPTNTGPKRRPSQPTHPCLLPRLGGARALPSIFLPSSSSSRASDQERRNLASQETGRRTQRGIKSTRVPEPLGRKEKASIAPARGAPRAPNAPAPRPARWNPNGSGAREGGGRPQRPDRGGGALGQPFGEHGGKPEWGKGRPRGACSDPHKRDRVPPAPASREPHRRKPPDAVLPKRSLPALPRADRT